MEVAGGANNQNYANVELIEDIAMRYDCDAVFAGWGHASENPKVSQPSQSHEACRVNRPVHVAMADNLPTIWLKK